MGPKPGETVFTSRNDLSRPVIADMRDRLLDPPFRIPRQNDGRLTKRARENHFAGLSDEETGQIEAIYVEDAIICAALPTTGSTACGPSDVALTGKASFAMPPDRISAAARSGRESLRAPSSVVGDDGIGSATPSNGWPPASAPTAPKLRPGRRLIEVLLAKR